MSLGVWDELVPHDTLKERCLSERMARIQDKIGDNQKFVSAGIECYMPVFTISGCYFKKGTIHRVLDLRKSSIPTLSRKTTFRVIRNIPAIFRD